MIRFLLFTFLFYILFIVATRVLRAFFGPARRPSQQPSVPDQAQSSKPIQEYTDVSEAKFKDIEGPNQDPNERDESKTT